MYVMEWTQNTCNVSRLWSIHLYVIYIFFDYLLFLVKTTAPAEAAINKPTAIAMPSDACVAVLVEPPFVALPFPLGVTPFTTPLPAGLEVST